MSGKKACVKQPRNTAAEDALPLLQLQALHHTHKEAPRLFLMAARLGFTDAQIADVLRKGLPKLNENDNAFTAALEAVPAGLVQDLGNWQDYHAEKDHEESQRCSGQVAPAVVRLSRSFSRAGGS